MNPQSDERKSALLAGLIIQQSNMALMFMGKAPHPETGKPIRDLESARLFIDQLEMLEEKTRGNLTQNEARMLADTLTGLRMAFVESVNEKETPAAEAGSSQASPPPPSTETAPASSAGEQPAPATEEPAPEPEGESRKKFSKKY